MLREENGGQKKTHPCAEVREEDEEEGFKRKRTEEDGAEETRFSNRRFYPVFISPLPVDEWKMAVPGFALHRLKGQDAEPWSVRISGNWRLTFEFREGQAQIVDYEDYH